MVHLVREIVAELGQQVQADTALAVGEDFLRQGEMVLVAPAVMEVMEQTLIRLGPLQHQPAILGIILVVAVDQHDLERKALGVQEAVLTVLATQVQHQMLAHKQVAVAVAPLKAVLVGMADQA
jgi:hypothetical protein